MKRHLFFLVLIFGISNLLCCKTSPTGEQLAKQHCSTCHIFPEPSLLPKHIWINKVLPNMATRMGIPREYPYAKLPSDDVQAVMEAHVIPDQPTISEADMMKIVEYYSKNAPEKAITQDRKIEPSPSLSQFEIKAISDTKMSSQNILLKELHGKIVLGFEDKGTLIYDFSNKKHEALNTSIATDFAVWKDKFYALDVTTIEAHNLPKDVIWEFPIINGSVQNKPKRILEGLIRPVSIDVADINNDQKPDFLISEFGDYLGRLSLFLSTQKGYKKEILKGNPGACKAYFKDLNNDGKLEIIALMSQGKEEIVVFEKSNSGFSEKQIATYPPCYGSNAMKIRDIDNDGLDDLIVTNGDNADMSSSLKKYHGVRILKNLGNLKFKEIWFYPIYGASEVEIEDFDKDGDLDFIVLSHFPDFAKEQEENLIYFQNNGGLKFIPLKPKVSLKGRPLTIEKADVDNDGDMDVLTGNHVDYLTNPGQMKTKNWASEKIGFWVLKNNLKP